MGSRPVRLHFLGPYPMMQIEATRIDGSERLDREASFVVPAVAASSELIRWWIVVRGRVAGTADFAHRFSVTVNAAAASPPRS